MKERWNLAAWALDHRPLTFFLAGVLFLAGAFSYLRLGRMEWPDFTIREMLVVAYWPGATARQVEEQLTDKLERKLQETPGLWHLRSMSRPGQATVFVTLKDGVSSGDVRPTWLAVRNLVADAAPTLPAGVLGPFCNDRFDDVYGSIYALTGDGFSYEELRAHAETIRRALVSIASVKKVELVGVQSEKIWIEMDAHRLARLGISPDDIAAAIRTQNAVAPAGKVETTSDEVHVRVSGIFVAEADIRAITVRGLTGLVRLSDIARVRRAYADPPDPRFYYDGKPAVGLAISMARGGNVLELGRALDAAFASLRAGLPLGLEVHRVADQPETVAHEINVFVESLVLAIAIVLLVCFVSLGWRGGVVVALSIPLVVLAALAGMRAFGVDLHNVSLGALILALGLLVDDAIIVIEMMEVKLRQGLSRRDAASFAYSATAMPLLTGTLITCAGFIPVGLAQGSAAEFVGSIFSVVTIALLVSWVVASAVTPVIGYSLVQAGGAPHDLYDNRFYRAFRRVLTWCLANRGRVLAGTGAVFAVAVLGWGLVKNDFFPDSVRPELVVQLRLPGGASFQATEREARRLAARLAGDPDIENQTAYVGQGAPRFVLTFEPTLATPEFAEFVIRARDLAARRRLERRLTTLLAEEFPALRVNIRPLAVGPPSPYPVIFRVGGPDHARVKALADLVAATVLSNRQVLDAGLDWYGKSKVARVDLDQDKARALGIDTRALSLALQLELSGVPVTEFRERDRTVEVLFRADGAGRGGLSRLKDLPVPLASGQFVPLDQVARIGYGAEEGTIWRRNLVPTIQVQARVVPGALGNDVAARIDRELDRIRAGLPAGYTIEIGGLLEQTIRSNGLVMEQVPLMLGVIVLLLMFQLQHLPKVAITLLTAPLGVIGIVPALLVTGKPMGFVVLLGVLALSGIIIRNSIVLIDQIEQGLAAGMRRHEAVVEAAVRRFRPIMLTALAAILGMIPLFGSVFWGPMAVAIAGGLFAATVLTLLVMPTMYAAWYRVHERE